MPSLNNRNSNKSISQPVGFSQNREVGGALISSWIKEDKASTKEVYGVFKGGGPKGAAFAGAIEAFEDSDMKWKGVAGTSAGAITAAVLAAGYDGASYGNIFKNIDFSELLDMHGMSCIHDAANKWTLESEVDPLTALIRMIDPSLLFSEEDRSLEKALQDKLEQKRFSKMDWAKWFSANAEYYLTEGAKVASSGIVNKVLPLLPESYYKGPKSIANKEELVEIFVGALSPWFGDLPAAIKNKMLTGDKQDSDKTMAILLGIYYKGGAFKGDEFLKLMENYLQLALRSNEGHNSAVPVTFRELAIPCKIIASDLSRQRILVFPEGLKEYGYDGKEGRMHYLDFPVAEAVRASMSLPLVYEPFYLPIETSKDETGAYTDWATLVDGGMLNNFPITQFTKEQDDTPIYGFWLGDEPDMIPTISTNQLLGYTQAVIESLTTANDQYALDQAPENFTLVDINLTIPSKPEEEEALLQARENTIDEINQRINSNKEILLNLADVRQDESADLALITLIDKKVTAIQQAITQATNRLMALNEEEYSQRDCGTLDFDLSIEQKQALIENGRKGANAALGNVKS